jgi:hypothetical protein
VGSTLFPIVLGLGGGFSFPIFRAFKGILPFPVIALFHFVWVFGFMWFLLRFTALRWSAERALVDSRGFFLKPGMCLACGYGIADLAPEFDGCRVCPECGAAWDTGPRPAPVVVPGPSPAATPVLRRVLAWTPSVVDAAGVRRRARWIKERWLWGAALPPAVHSAPGAAAWRRAGLAMTAILASGSTLMAYAVAFEKLELGPEGEFRREAGLVLLGIILLLRLCAVRAVAEGTLAAMARQLTPDDSCLACGVPLARGRMLAPARVQCITCGGQWHVPEASAQST